MFFLKFAWPQEKCSGLTKSAISRIYEKTKWRMWFFHFLSDKYKRNQTCVDGIFTGKEWQLMVEKRICIFSYFGSDLVREGALLREKASIWLKNMCNECITKTSYTTYSAIISFILDLTLLSLLTRHLNCSRTCMFWNLRMLFVMHGWESRSVYIWDATSFDCLFTSNIFLFILIWSHHKFYML